MNGNEIKEEDRIRISDIWHAIIKNIWLCIIITLGITLIGAIYTFAIAKPKYKASTTLVVAVKEDINDDKFDYNNSLRLMYTIKDLVKQDVVLDKVSEENNIPLKLLKQKVNVLASENSYLINIDVVDSNINIAVKLVNEIANELINEVDTNPVFSFAKDAVKVTSPSHEAIYDSPNKTIYLIISVLIGGVVALVVVWIKELASNKYKNKRQVEAEFSDNIIGTFYDDSKLKKNQEKKGQKVVDLVQPSIRSFEPYNKLLSNIKYSNLEHPYKVIMTAATGMNELKSTICSNLAYCMVNNDKKVCIIDLDTRKPILHKTFKVSREHGLVDYIEGTIDKTELIKHSESGVDVITVGKKVINPVVILEAQKLKDLVKELKEEYDFVLLDTPPLNICADALAISKLSDGVIFNIAMGQSRKSDIKDTLENLKGVGANVIGLNLTKVEFTGKKSSYYYYHYEED